MIENAFVGDGLPSSKKKPTFMALNSSLFMKAATPNSPPVSSSVFVVVVVKVGTFKNSFQICIYDTNLAQMSHELSDYSFGRPSSVGELPPNTERQCILYLVYLGHIFGPLRQVPLQMADRSNALCRQTLCPCVSLT